VLVICLARLGPKAPALAWPEAALASSMSGPSQSHHRRLGPGLAWPKPRPVPMPNLYSQGWVYHIILYITYIVLRYIYIYSFSESTTLVYNIKNTTKGSSRVCDSSPSLISQGSESGISRLNKIQWSARSKGKEISDLQHRKMQQCPSRPH
jgi:hypothetical protein